MKEHLEMFLTSAGETNLLAAPRACSFIRRMASANRDDYALVKIDPVLHYTVAEGVTTTLDHLILSTRHVGHTLFPIDEWPAWVYVARFLGASSEDSSWFGPHEVELIAKGMLHQSYEAAYDEALRWGHKLERRPTA